MKRNNPFNSEENKNGCPNNKQWCPPPTSSSSSEPNSTTDSQTQNQANEPQRSEAATLPTTSSTQSFPWLAPSINRNSEMFKADSSQNPYLMPFGRNCAWPDNRMFSMPITDPNMTVNSTVMPFVTNADSMANLNRKESELDSQQAAGRSPSPLPVFTDEEVDKVNEMLKEKNTLRQGLKILTGWLKRGDCNKTNNNDFIDMIKYAHNQVWRLMSEKTEIKEELNEVQREVSKGFNHILSQFEEIDHVFEVAILQKVWDHFTKPQRKNIEYWKKSAKELKRVFTNQQDYDEEEVNDDDVHRSPDSSQDHEEAEFKKEYEKLKEQLDNLQNQLQGADNENEIISREIQENAQEHENTFGNLEERCLGFDASIAKLKKYKKDALASALKKSGQKKIDKSNLSPPSQTSTERVNTPDEIEVQQREVFLLTLISTFLYVHPFGASLDYICSYLISFDPDLNTRYLENLLTKFPKIFKAERRGIGACLTINWYFKGFKEERN